MVPFFLRQVVTTGVDGPEGGLKGLPQRESPAVGDERIIEHTQELQGS